jgi:voltage-gated potassium channel
MAEPDNRLGDGLRRLSVALEPRLERRLRRHAERLREGRADQAGTDTADADDAELADVVLLLCEAKLDEEEGRREDGPVDARSLRIEERFEVPMIVAAVLVIPTLLLEQAGEPWRTLSVVLNYLIWGAFVVEAAVMLSVTSDRWRWIRGHPLELIIIVVTPPFVLSVIQPIRSLRIFRLLRLLRLAPLVHRLFTRQGLQYTAYLVLLTALAGGAAYHDAESGKSFWDGVYWAITTMATVGYGSPPVTTTGKVVAVTVMLVGIGFVALLTGAIAEAFIAPRARQVARAAAGSAHASEVSEERILAGLGDISARLSVLEQRLDGRDMSASLEGGSSAEPV